MKMRSWVRFINSYIFLSLYGVQYRKEMHCSSVPKILQNTIYEISNNRENFNENPSMRAIITILRAQTNEHLSKFCEQIEQRLNFASTWKFQLKDHLIPLKLSSHCD